MVFNVKLIFYGHCEYIFTDAVLDKIILLAKMFIYRNKVQGQILNIQNFIRYVYERYTIEKQISKDPFEVEKIWYPYKNLFLSLM